MKTTIDGSHRINRWFDVREFLAGAEAPCKLADTERGSVSRHLNLGTIADAVALAWRGWSDGTTEISKLRAKIRGRLSGRIADLEAKYDVTGLVVDPARLAAGEPESCFTLVDASRLRKAQKPSRVRIVCNVSASHAATAETFLRRGAAVIVLADTLERRGIRCQIDIVKSTTNSVIGTETLENVFTVKRYGDPIVINKLAFFVGHVATLRRLFWSIQEHEDRAVRARFGIGGDTRGSYGFPGEATDRGDIYLGCIRTARDWDEDFTMAWLAAQLAKQGITLESKVV